MSNRVQMNEDRKIYTVSELTRIIKLAIEDAVPRCWLVGEFSNLIVVNKFCITIHMIIDDVVEFTYLRDRAPV